jgi:hypothetical protein
VTTATAVEQWHNDKDDGGDPTAHSGDLLSDRPADEPVGRASMTLPPDESTKSIATAFGGLAITVGMCTWQRRHGSGNAAK